MHQNSRKKLPNRLTIVTSLLLKRYTHEQRASLYLNLICIYQGTEHKNYKKVLSIKEQKFGTRYHMNLKNYHSINLN